MARKEEYATISLDNPGKGFLVFETMTTPAQFLRETYDELKLVKWSKRKDIINLTGVVILISVLVGIYIGGIDYILTKVTELLIQ